MFLFSMKHPYLLTTKITPGVNNSLYGGSYYITKDDFEGVQVNLV